MKIAIVPGSFDPMTLGHKDIVERATKLFDKVIVAIMINPAKVGKFTFAERKKIAELTLSDVPRASVITADGYLADLAAALKAVCATKSLPPRGRGTAERWKEITYQEVKLCL